MSIRTILTVVTGATAQGAALRQAMALAEAQDAHLDVLSLGVDLTQASYQYLGNSVVLLPETLNRARDDARSTAEAVQEVLNQGNARSAVETSAARLVDVTRGVGVRARFCDLAVLPAPFAEGLDDDAEAIVEGALFEGGVPVLTVPEGAAPVTAPRRIMLGWDDSAEALRAARAALPLLAAAERVSLVIVDPPTHGPERSDPGGAMAQYLARHDVDVEVMVLGRTLPRICDVIMQRARDEGAELIVMGAYGHSRWREALLGGTTRDMLRESELPLFLAH